MRSVLQHLANIAIILVMGLTYVMALLIGTALKHVTKRISEPVGRAIGFLNRQAGNKRPTS